MKFKDKKILITGGAGFIGSHVADALLAGGAHVVVVDNLSTGRKENVSPRAKFYKLDMNDSSFGRVFKKERPEFVYMLGFNTDAPRSVSEPLFDVKSITASLQTLEYACAYGVRKVIFSSTNFVYGNTNVLPTPETEPPRPDNPYSISKTAVEQYIRFYREARGLEYVIFRYGTTYGPRQSRGAMADYIRSIYAGKQSAIYGDGTKTRDYTFISDIVRANLLAISYRPAAGVEPTFNLSAGRQTSLYSLYKKIARLLGHPEAEPRFLPDRPGEIFRAQLSSAKAKKLFNWKSEVGLNEGLAQTVEYFLAHNT